MAETPEVNREAWASLIAALLKTEADGNQTRFAAKVRVTPRTVSRWLEQGVAVKPESVTEVARALGRSPVDMLIRVGYLSPNEASTAQRQSHDPDVLRWMAILADPNVPEDQKELMRLQMRLWAAQIDAHVLDSDADEPPESGRRVAQ